MQFLFFMRPYHEAVEREKKVYKMQNKRLSLYSFTFSQKKNMRKNRFIKPFSILNIAIILIEVIYLWYKNNPCVMSEPRLIKTK